MVYLATIAQTKRVLLPELAEATDAPESFLSKVLQALTRANLISSRRGRFGGFAILPQGCAASMHQVIEAVDGPICLNMCLSAGRGCDRSSWCPAHPVWARAQQAMVSVLKQVSVAELAAQSTPSRFRHSNLISFAPMRSR